MPKNTRLLHTHRHALLVLERVRVRVEDQRVVYDEAEGAIERTFNIPHANLAFLLLGQGSSVTQAAMRLLADEGVVVGFTGSGGTPLFMASTDTYRPTERLRTWLTIYLDAQRSLEVARETQRQRLQTLAKEVEKVSPRLDFDDLKPLCDRFAAQIDRADSVEALRGHEGDFCRALYAAVSEQFRIQGFQRYPGAADEQATDDSVRRVNRLLDHGNYLVYGLAAVVLWAYGIPAGLPVMHGASRAGGLVFDVADMYKDAYILPLACESTSRGERDQRFRERAIATLDRQSVLKRAFEQFDALLQTHGAQ